MAPLPPPISRIFLLLFILLFSSVSAWKKDEFRNCNQTPFCKRARSRAPHSLPHVSVSDLSISEGDLTARLLFPHSTTDAADPSEYPIRSLLLRLSVYQGGILRLKIDEDYSSPSASSKKRFEVPDVTLPDLDDRRLWLSRVSSANDGSFSSIYLSDGFEAILRHDPFEVQVRRKGSNQPVISLNSHGLFDFEQLREKKEGEDWEERFRGHTDTRPYGPQSISFDVSFHHAEFVYGIPEHGSTSLALRPTRGPGVEHSEPYRLYNLDVFEYLHDSPFGLYGSVPFMLSHGLKSSSGFFWLNAAEMQIDVLAPGWDDPASADHNKIDTFWMSEAGIVDAFFFVGPDPKDVLYQYASVTGTLAMPQEFAVAYHQCRWNYRDEEDVASVDTGFDEHDIPYDVLWLDIEHTDGKRYFTWDRVLFPNPEQMQKKLATKGRHMVTIVDPHIKRDDLYYVHKEASENGYYVKDATGKDFDGWCWSGSSSYPDFLNPKIREWWSEKFSLNNYVGSTPSLYVWNDMNEPSVFNGPEISFPRDVLHYGGVENRELHNAYGYYIHMATADGIFKRGNGKDRPFVLSRAFFAGSQRHGAIWTGDNSADWDHFRASVPMVLTLGLTGISFSGADVGGFFGNPESELLVRWYQLGAYYPFFRAHAHHDTKRREPWLFGDKNTALIREAIHTRYTLLPYYYTLFRKASVSGIPILRPLWLEFPDDRETFNDSEAFMVGESILVRGIYEEGQKAVSIYLPGEQSWYSMKNGAVYSGGHTHKLEVTDDSIPSFQRAGSIVPRKYRLRRSTTQMANDPYTLVIALNSSLAAEGELYIDDGRSYDFELGAYIHRRFVFSDGKLTSTSMQAAALDKKKFSSSCIVERIILLGLPSGAKKAVVEPGNQEAEIEPGPLTLRPGASPVALVIRKPNVRIADDWTIQVL